MKNSFDQIIAPLFSGLLTDEQIVVNFHGEQTLFIRFNKSKVRQVSDVLQMELTLTLKYQGKESTMTIPVSNSLKADLANCNLCLTKLRERISELQALPFFVDTENNGTSNSVNEGNLLSCEEYLDIIATETAGVDMAGILISGTTFIGNANSKGQHHWFASTSFCFDYSLYNDKEKAVKATYSGCNFSRSEFVATLSEARTHLAYMSIDNKVLPPGKYKCYLAPAAVSEILGTFNWGGPSHSGLKRGNSPLQLIENEGLVLSELFTLKEDFTLGLHPSFNAEGEVARQSMNVFVKGKLENLLTSSRTANEFQLISNFANEEESLRSPVVETGKLAKEDILKELDNGIYISNLHYLNWSDSKKGRITGMTRFACFVVENGKITAPIKDLRFDETIYNIWGVNLLAVTDFAETEVSTNTYSQRSVGGSRCPGMLVKDFNFTL